MNINICISVFKFFILFSQSSLIIGNIFTFFLAIELISDFDV